MLAQNTVTNSQKKLYNRLGGVIKATGHYSKVAGTIQVVIEMVEYQSTCPWTELSLDSHIKTTKLKLRLY